MKDLIPKLEDGQTVLNLLIMAEILAKRGERGPLARITPVCRQRCTKNAPLKFSPQKVPIREE